MKRLLIMAKSLGGGGTEVALIEFLNSLDFKKFDVTLLLLNEDKIGRASCRERVSS